MFEPIHTLLRENTRLSLGRVATPGAGVLDGPSVKTPEKGGLNGARMGAKRSRARHRFMDRHGLFLQVEVHSADITDPQGAKGVLETVQQN